MDTIRGIILKNLGIKYPELKFQFKHSEYFQYYLLYKSINEKEKYHSMNFVDELDEVCSEFLTEEQLEDLLIVYDHLNEIVEKEQTILNDLEYNIEVLENTLKPKNEEVSFLEFKNLHLEFDNEIFLCMESIQLSKDDINLEKFIGNFEKIKLKFDSFNNMPNENLNEIKHDNRQFSVNILKFKNLEASINEGYFSPITYGNIA